MVRNPAVAGVFYPAGKNMLIDTLKDCFLGPLGPGKLPKPVEGSLERPIGAIVPHAGYMYSGQVAAWSYLELSKHGKPRTAILIGPNHTGYGARVGVYPGGFWRTPLGDVEVDEEAARMLLENSAVLREDEISHRYEHSLEVQLPFLQFIYGSGFKIVPIAMMDQSPEAVVDLSRAISTFLTINPSTVILASTDLNHYEDHDITLEKDSLVIESIESMDVKKLYDSIHRYGISMCGYGPVATLILLNLGKPKILKHATSGEVSGDFSQVVGYLSVVFE